MTCVAPRRKPKCAASSADLFVGAALISANFRVVARRWSVARPYRAARKSGSGASAAGHSRVSREERSTQATGPIGWVATPAMTVSANGGGPSAAWRRGGRPTPAVAERWATTSVAPTRLLISHFSRRPFASEYLSLRVLGLHLEGRRSVRDIGEAEVRVFRN